MADLHQFKEKYQNFKSTFKTTSFDSAKSDSLCKDTTQEVLNFDKIIEERYPDSNKRPKSFDAVYLHGKYIFCIEFKNQKSSQINNENVTQKLTDGKSELDKLLKELKIQVNEYSFIYCVVYKDFKEHTDRYKSGIGKNAILFGLQKCKKHIVDDIFTENVSFFTKEFKKQISKELNC